MKNFFLFLAFLSFLTILSISEGNAQSFSPLSLIKYQLPFVGAQQPEGSDEVSNDETESIDSKERVTESVKEEGVKPKPAPKPASRLTIDLGKALFEKYIK